MKTKKVFKPCREGKHKTCKKELEKLICVCKCHISPIQTKLAAVSLSTAIGRPATLSEKRLRKVYVGVPLAERQSFVEVCIFCGDDRTVYPSSEFFPDEIAIRQDKYACRKCRNDAESATTASAVVVEREQRKSKKQMALEYKRDALLREAQRLAGTAPVCEECGENHETSECS